MVGQLGSDTPSVMFADGSLGAGGPFQDGIITINSLQPVQFTRPVAEGNFDGRMFTEHEIDEVLGMGSHLWRPGPAVSCPTGLIQLVKPQRAQHQFEWPAFLLARSIVDSTTSLSLTRTRRAILGTGTATPFVRQIACM